MDLSEQWQEQVTNLKDAGANCADLLWEFMEFFKEAFQEDHPYYEEYCELYDKADAAIIKWKQVWRK